MYLQFDSFCLHLFAWLLLRCLFHVASPMYQAADQNKSSAILLLCSSVCLPRAVEPELRRSEGTTCVSNSCQLHCAGMCNEKGCHMETIHFATHPREFIPKENEEKQQQQQQEEKEEEEEEEEEKQLQQEEKEEEEKQQQQQQQRQQQQQQESIAAIETAHALAERVEYQLSKLDVARLALQTLLQLHNEQLRALHAKQASASLSSLC